MTTHGKTIFLFGGEYRISDAASDAFFPNYGQLMVNSIHNFVNYLDEARFQAAVRGSVQLSYDFRGGQFNDPIATQKILDVGVLEPSIIPTWQSNGNPSIWEIEPDVEEAEEQASALLSVSYAHNFIAQFMSGVFFRFYDMFDYTGISFEVLKSSRDFNILVNMDERKAYFEDIDEDAPLIEVSFDDIFTSKVSLEKLSTCK